jgi:hypothetical protein
MTRHQELRTVGERASVASWAQGLREAKAAEVEAARKAAAEEEKKAKAQAYDADQAEKGETKRAGRERAP